MKFGLSQTQIDLLKKLVVRPLLASIPQCQILIYGSRARGDFKPNSDIDLLIESPSEIPIQLIVQIKDSLEESSLPFKVDLVQQKDLPASYLKTVNAEKVAFK